MLGHLEEKTSVDYVKEQKGISSLPDAISHEYDESRKSRSGG